MELSQIVANNLQRICKEHDLSSNELANRSGMPQKTIYSMIQGVTPAVLITSKRSPRRFW